MFRVGTRLASVELFISEEYGVRIVSSISSISELSSTLNSSSTLVSTAASRMQEPLSPVSPGSNKEDAAAADCRADTGRGDSDLAGADPKSFVVGRVDLY